jgi:hypothetical protein
VASPSMVIQAPTISTGSIPSFVLRGCVEDSGNPAGEVVFDVSAGSSLGMGDFRGRTGSCPNEQRQCDPCAGRRVEAWLGQSSHLVIKW